MMEQREWTPMQHVLLSAAGKGRARAELVMELDRECAHIARSAREPMMAQIRLAWWRDGLSAAEALSAHRSPMMDALRTVDGFADIRAGLIAMIDGWEELILWDGEGAEDMLSRYAGARGGGFFAAIAPHCSAQAQIWGKIWALWDVSGHLGDAELAAQAVKHGQILAAEAKGASGLPRMLAMLAGAARHDLLQGRGMAASLTPSLYMRLLRIQIFGR